MVLIVETGISLMELDCHSLEMMIYLRLVKLRELIYVVVTVPHHQLVSIAVILQLMLTVTETQSMWDCILLVEV